MSADEPIDQVRLPSWLRASIHSAWSGYGLLTVAVAAPAAAGGVVTSVGWQWGLICFGALCAVAEAVRQNFLNGRREQRLQSARTAAEDAVVELTLLLGTLVEPIAELISQLAATRSKPQRRELARSLTEKVVQAASAICGPNEIGATRAVFFRLQGGQLIFVTHHGRAPRPRHELPAAAVAVAQSRRNALIRDVATDAPDPSEFVGATYRTFLSCSVYSGNEVHGLLTVDAVKAGTLTKRDLRSALVLGHLLGAGLALAEN